MEITVTEQTWMFVMSIALGAALGVCYDVFRILRIALRHPTGVVLAEDILFSVVCAAASFLYMLSADRGQLRVFVLVGEVVGFAIYYCTIGTLVIGLSKRIIAAFQWLLCQLWRIFIAPIIKIMRHIYGFFHQMQKKSTVYLKTAVKNSNIHLKRSGHVLYNLRKRLQKKTHGQNTQGRGKQSG